MNIPILLASLALTFTAPAPALQSAGPYHVIRVVKVGGDGGFDYVNADSAGRKLYVARRSRPPHIAVYSLDTLQQVGDIPNTGAHGASIDDATHHAFATSKPVTMIDTESLAIIKTIEVDGSPDGALNDNFNHRTYILSHQAPNVTVIDDASGSVLGTIDLGGAPEEAATDGHGTIYIDLEDKDAVAVVDAKTMKLVNTYSLNGKGGGNAGLALDARRHVLYVACREPQVMVMLDSRNGNFLGSEPIGRGCDGVVFNPRTGECFASLGDGTVSILKQTGPSAFEVEQVVNTMPGAKTCTLDTKTGHVFLIAAEYAAPAAGQRRGAMVPGSFSIIEVGK